LSNDLARKYRIDVSTDAATWIQIGGVSDFNPQVANNDQDASAYDTNGWTAFETTMKSWTTTVKALVRRTAGVLDAGLALCKDRQLSFGDSERLYVRWYLRDTGAEAVQGRAIVSYNRSKTGVADLDEVQVEFKGDGALAAISDVTVTQPVPQISSALPSGAAQGALVTITGAYFTTVTGAAGVKFGATNATNYQIVSDSVIVATMPAGSAGAANIVVTNTTGASAAFSYTRGA
jgi:hypothetical protein